MSRCRPDGALAVVRQWDDDDRHGAHVKGVAFAPGGPGGLLAAAGADGRVSLCDPRSAAGFNAARFVTDAHEGGAHSVKWRPSGAGHHQLASAGGDAVVKIWDVRSAKQPLASLSAHQRGKPKRSSGMQRPLFYDADTLLSGGDGSGRVTVYRCGAGDAWAVDARIDLDGEDASAMALGPGQVALSSGRRGSPVILVGP